MYRNNVKNILSQVKISKNNEVNDFMKSFVYHNEKFFEKCLRLKMGNFRKLPFQLVFIMNVVLINGVQLV